jgi:hypothetical protein
MNKWKVAFWICLVCSLIIFTIGLKTFIETEISLGFTKDDRNAYKEDLEITTTIINKNLRTKKEVEEEFSVNGYSPFFNEEKDSSYMLRTQYIFKNDTIIKIILIEH